MNTGNDTVLLQEGSSSHFEMNPALMTPDEWSMIAIDAITISSNLNALDNEMVDENWDADDFDLLTSHCPWEMSPLNLPKLDSSSSGAAQYNLIDDFNSKLSCDTGMLSFESLHNSTVMNANLLLDLDDSLTATDFLKMTSQRNASYTVTKDTSFLIAKTNHSPLNCDLHSSTAAELLKTPPTRNMSYTIPKTTSPFVIARSTNESYTIAKTNDSYTVAKGNASYTISTTPPEVSPTPGSASKNSSFSEVAEKFHSLRRSMSSDSVLPLSQEKIRGLSLTTRALVPTPPLPPAGAAFCAAVADMRLRPGRAPLAAKGPMRAMLPLGQMMRAPTEVPTPPPPSKPRCPQIPSSPLPAVKPSPELHPKAVSTPVCSTPSRKSTPPRRSISMSPVRRATPMRSASSGYGQRRSAGKTESGRQSTSEAKHEEARWDATSLTNVERKPAGAVPKSALPAPTGSRLRWPSASGIAKLSCLPQPVSAAKGIPKPVLAVTNPNVRVSRLKAPLRTTHKPLSSVKGKENRC